MRSDRRRRAGGYVRSGGYIAPVLVPRSRVAAAAALLGAVWVGGASPAVRIVGGATIQVQSAPWAVYVSVVSGSAGQDCSGSVIDATHVVTAAHCLYVSAATAQASDVSVKAGVSNFIAATPTDAEQDRQVSSFRVHPGYVNNGAQVPDDVAVLTLSAPLDLSGQAVKAVALPAANASFPAGAAAIVAGFGIQSSSQERGGPLESLSTTVDPQGQCGAFTRTSAVLYSNGTELCSTSAAGAECSGDSGAGLVTTGGTPVLVGVANGVAPGCPVGGAGLFAYVQAPEILEFIDGNNAPPTAPRAASSTLLGLTPKGPVLAGEKLTCYTGHWPEPVKTAYTFKNAADGQILQTGPGATYLLPASSVGTTIACQVAVTDGGGTTVETTRPTPAVKPAAPLGTVAIEPLSPLTAKRGQYVFLHIVLKSSRGLSGTFKACAQLPAGVGVHSGICRSTSEASGAH